MKFVNKIANEINLSSMYLPTSNRKSKKLEKLFCWVVAVSKDPLKGGL